ncbi:MAG TPA: hypothetical protein VH054_05580 [Polyangiaceae bacterium]|jgi:hypothetical protein|nr:hypothetical protein [Polyangiaceae bacterium]
MRGTDVGSEGIKGAVCAGGVFTTPVTGSGVVTPSIDAFFCARDESFATAANCSARPSATTGKCALERVTESN